MTRNAIFVLLVCFLVCFWVCFLVFLVFVFGYEWLVPSMPSWGPFSVPSPAYVLLRVLVSVVPVHKFRWSCALLVLAISALFSVSAYFSPFLLCVFPLWCSVVYVTSPFLLVFCPCPSRRICVLLMFLVFVGFFRPFCVLLLLLLLFDSPVHGRTNMIFLECFLSMHCLPLYFLFSSSLSLSFCMSIVVLISVNAFCMLLGFPIAVSMRLLFGSLLVIMLMFVLQCFQILSFFAHYMACIFWYLWWCCLVPFVCVLLAPRLLLSMLLRVVLLRWLWGGSRRFSIWLMGRFSLLCSVHLFLLFTWMCFLDCCSLAWLL